MLTEVWQEFNSEPKSQIRFSDLLVQQGFYAIGNYINGQETNSTPMITTAETSVTHLAIMQEQGWN